jgi:hypothetical protein
MLHFLFELFEKTSSVIVNDLKEATTPSERITQFREFMTAGQKMAGVGANRKKFYEEVAAAVESVSRFPIKLSYSYILQRAQTSETSSEQVKGALKNLISHIGDRTPRAAKFPQVFIAFDEAHPLADLESIERRTYFTELRSVIQDVGSNSYFCFFLSTTSKVSRFAMLRDIAGSAGMENDFIPSIPFSDLGFDQLMHDRKIFSKFRTLDDHN